MRLKELRQERHKTQEEIANELKIKKQTYQNYELKKREPDINTLIQLAHYFNVSIDYLIGNEHKNNFNYIPEKRKNLIKEILNLNDNEVREVESFIKGFKAGKAGTSDFSIF